MFYLQAKYVKLAVKIYFTWQNMFHIQAQWIIFAGTTLFSFKYFLLVVSALWDGAWPPCQKKLSILLYSLITMVREMSMSLSVKTKLRRFFTFLARWQMPGGRGQWKQCSPVRRVEDASAEPKWFPCMLKLIPLHHLVKSFRQGGARGYPYTKW